MNQSPPPAQECPQQIKSRNCHFERLLRPSQSCDGKLWNVITMGLDGQGLKDPPNTETSKTQRQDLESYERARNHIQVG